MSDPVFRTLCEAGITCSLVDGTLVVASAVEPPPAVCALIRLAKRELTALLLAERAPAMWGKDDWRAYFAERAAMLEFDGGLTRAEAEAEALAACLQLYTGRRVG